MLRLFPIVLLTSAALLPFAGAQFFNDFDQPPHDYWTAPMHDPMTALIRRMDAGEVEIDEAPGLPLVERLLKELDIPVESQVLVFSRTSLQRGVVSPQTPRAIYFNDDTYLGWMPDGRIEIASSDPERGAVFYFQRKLDDRDGPMFTRDKVCIQCHAGSATNFLPGLLGRSVYPDGKGRSLKAIESFERIGHNVPLEDRWGGWYVTGGHAGLRHMGNALAKRGAGGVDLDRVTNAALPTAKDRFESERYPRDDSDIVALLVMDHQISMHFRLMEAQYVARQLVVDAGWSDGVVPKERPAEFSEELEATAARVVQELLFQSEAPLGETKIAGGGDFEKTFLDRKIVDGKGRSLRDLHLKGRLFEYRCSFMIHSDSFTKFHPVLKTEVFRQLRKILAGEGGADFDYLGEGERKAIDEILSATVEGFSASK